MANGLIVFCNHTTSAVLAWKATWPAHRSLVGTPYSEESGRALTPSEDCCCRYQLAECAFTSTWRVAPFWFSWRFREIPRPNFLGETSGHHTCPAPVRPRCKHHSSTLGWHESWCRAKRLACFREYICGYESFAPQGSHVAYSLYSFDQSPALGEGQNIAIVDWTLTDSTSYCLIPGGSFGAVVHRWVVTVSSSQAYKFKCLYIVVVGITTWWQTFMRWWLWNYTFRPERRSCVSSHSWLYSVLCPYAWRGQRSYRISHKECSWRDGLRRSFHFTYMGYDPAVLWTYSAAICLAKWATVCRCLSGKYHPGTILLGTAIWWIFHHLVAVNDRIYIRSWSCIIAILHIQQRAKALYQVYSLVLPMHQLIKSWGFVW